MPKTIRMAGLVFFVAAMVTTGSAAGQDDEETPRPEVREAPGEFQFVRLAYSANRYGRGGGWGRRQRWETDFPDAEEHFTRGVERLTRIDVAEYDRILTPLDDNIFDYPWIYAVEVGYWYLNDDEAAHMRDYLLRGGFLMVDDFHGSWEWAAFVASMEKVFPDRPIIDIPESDEAFHVHYDLDHRIQIPSRMFIYSGVTYEKDGYTPYWRAIRRDRRGHSSQNLRGSI